MEKKDREAVIARVQEWLGPEVDRLPPSPDLPPGNRVIVAKMKSLLGEFRSLDTNIDDADRDQAIRHDVAAKIAADLDGLMSILPTRTTKAG